MQVSTTWGGLSVSGTVTRNPYYTLSTRHEDYCPDEEPFRVCITAIREVDGEPLCTSEVSDFIREELEAALVEAWQELQYEPDTCFQYA